MQMKWLQKALDVIVVFGVGFLLGDGVLTPAISVVSAVEGLQIAPGVGGSISRSGPPPSLPPSHDSLLPAVLSSSG